MNNFIRNTIYSISIGLLLMTAAPLEAQIIVRQSQSVSQKVTFSTGNNFGGGWWGSSTPYWHGSRAYWGQQYGPYDRQGFERLPRREGHHYFRTPEPTHYIERNRLDHGYIGDYPDERPNF